MTEFCKTYDEKMGKTIESVKGDFASVRAGRANAGVLDRIQVEYYGTPTPAPSRSSPGTGPSSRPSRRPSRAPTWASTPRTTGG